MINQKFTRACAWVAMMYCPIVLGAQTSTLTPGSVYRVLGKERWLHPGERAESAQWTDSRDGEVEIDSIASTASGGRVFYSHRNNGASEATLFAWRNSRGQLDSVTTSIKLLDIFGSIPASKARPELPQVKINHEAADNSELLFNQYLMFLGAPRTTGMRTPLHLRIGSAQFGRTLDGVVSSKWIRDTVVNGRALGIIADSGSVTCTTTDRSAAATRGDSVTRVRKVSGVVRARRLHDPKIDASMWFADTTVLAGFETMTDGRGVSHTVPVRFEQMRVIDLLDSTSRAAWYDSASRVAYQPVQRPNSHIPTVRDSLLEAHARSTRQSQRDSIEGMFDLYVTGVRELFARSYAARGDTAAAVRFLRPERLDVLTAWSYGILRSVLNDPARAMRFGQSIDELFQQMLTQVGNRHYNGAGAFRPWCDPDACTEMARDWTEAREPRLRYLGLIGAMYSDPARWTATLLRSADSGVKMLESTQAFILAAHVDVGLPKLTFPGASDDWRAWWAWWRGGTDASFERRDSLMRASGQEALPRQPFVFATDVYRLPYLSPRIWFEERRFGVSYKDSLEVKLAVATNDTARYVYRAILSMLFGRVKDGSHTFEAMQSTNPIERARGFLEVHSLEFRPADSTTSLEIESALLDAMIDGKPLWPNLMDTTKATSSVVAVARDNGRWLVFADSLTEQARNRLQAAGVPLVTLSQRFSGDSRGRSIAIFGRVMQAANFARVTLAYKVLARWPSGSSHYHATVLLVRVNGQWKFIDNEVIEI